MARIIIVRSSGGPELEVDQTVFNEGFFPGYVYVRDASGSPTNPLGPLATDMNTVLADSTSAPSVTLRAAFVRVFTPEAYGAKGDGTTDDTAAVQAAVQAAYNAAGGTVLFAAKTYLLTSQLVIPNDAGTRPVQPPIRLTGAGARWDGTMNQQASITGGTVLDLRSTTGPAKIDTRGSGALIIDNLTLTQAGSAADTNPFLQTTNTTLILRDLAFYGHSTLTGATCVQDAIVLGGTTTTIGNGSTAAFQGYGTVIERCYFARIQRAAYLRTYANSIVFRSNTVTLTCGAGSSAAAIQIDGTVGFARGNVIRDNLIEVTGYVYGVRLTNAGANVCEGNQFWDATGSLLACYLLEGASSANVADNQLSGVFTGTAVAKWLVDSTGGANYTLRGGPDIFGATLSSAQNYVQPAAATGSENTKILHVARSQGEASNPGQDITTVAQNGRLSVGGSWSTTAGFTATNGTASLSSDHTSIVKNDAGNLDIYGGTGATNVVRIRRGLLQADSGVKLSAAGVSHFTGTGAPAIAGAVGDAYWRQDGGAGAWLYKCTTAGAAGVAVWAAVI